MTIGRTAYRPLNYCMLNFNASRTLWNKAAADKTHLFALPLIATVALFELAIKNPALLLANCAIHLINATQHLVHQLSALFQVIMARLYPAQPNPAGPANGDSPRPQNRALLQLPRALSNLFGRVANRPAPDLYRPAINATPPLPGQQFSAEELSAFKVALRSIADKGEIAHVQPEVEGPIFAVWYDPGTTAIHIQNVQDQHQRNKNNLITVMINAENRITSITINGTKHEQIPAEFLPRFRACFLRSLEISSRYNDLRFEVIPRSLKEVPDFHLDRLARAIRNSPHFAIRVNFLHSIQENHQGGLASDGTDAGGPRREYMDTLAESLTVRQLALPPDQRLLHYWEHPERHLLLPCAKGEEGALLDVPDLSFSETKMFQEMGEMIAYCYHHNLLIGKRFHPGLFRAAFSLPNEALNAPFDQLTHETKLEMAERIARADEEPEESIRFINLAKKGDGMTINELRSVEGFLEANGDLPPSIDHESFDPFIGAQKDAVIEALRDVVYKKGGVGKSLAAIHAIAKGMKQMHDRLAPRHHPQRFQDINPEQYDRKVQGSIDRNTVADAIRNHASYYVAEKVRWLKGWLRHEATSEEVYKFVKWVTGSSSLPVGGQITVERRRAGSLPEVHTCFSTIEIPDGQEERDSFIARLKEWCLPIEGCQMA